MISILTIIVCALTILASEALGRGTVLYGRLLRLFITYAVLFILAAATAYLKGLILLKEASLVLLTGISLLAAWSGFRTHISNSITLNMLDMIVEHQAMTLTGIEAEYDVQAKIRARKEALIKAGYLDSGQSQPSSKNFKTMFIVKLVSWLR